MEEGNLHEIAKKYAKMVSNTYDVYMLRAMREYAKSYYKQEIAKVTVKDIVALIEYFRDPRRNTKQNTVNIAIRIKSYVSRQNKTTKILKKIYESKDSNERIRTTIRKKG